jgi:hypothetical protein
MVDRRRFRSAVYANGWSPTATPARYATASASIGICDRRNDASGGYDWAMFGNMATQPIGDSAADLLTIASMTTIMARSPGGRRRKAAGC